MARDTLTVQTIPANGGALASVTFTNIVAANDMEFTNDGKTMLLIKNGGTSGTQSPAVTTPADAFGRERPSTEDIDVAQGDTAIAGPFDPEVFNTGGKVYIDCATEDALGFAAVKFTPVK